MSICICLCMWEDEKADLVHWEVFLSSFRGFDLWVFFVTGFGDVIWSDMMKMKMEMEMKMEMKSNP